MKFIDIVTDLGLRLHPEGGYYKETLRLDQKVFIIDDEKKETYSAGTSIYYLLGNERQGNFSAWHRLHGLDEIWNYHAGAPITIYILEKNGNLVTKKLGLGAGAQPQVHLPRNLWFAAVIDDDAENEFALVGCVVFPGFDFAKFELADRNKLIDEFPQHHDIISRFTRLLPLKKSLA